MSKSFLNRVYFFGLMATASFFCASQVTAGHWTGDIRSTTTHSRQVVLHCGYKYLGHSYQVTFSSVKSNACPREVPVSMLMSSRS